MFLSALEFLSLYLHLFIRDYYLLLLHIYLFSPTDISWNSPHPKLLHLPFPYLRKRQYHFSSCSGQNPWILIHTPYPSENSIASSEFNYFSNISTATHHGQSHIIASWIFYYLLTISLFPYKKRYLSSVFNMWPHNEGTLCNPSPKRGHTGALLSHSSL